MKNINYFTVGQYIYHDIAIFKLSNKYHDTKKELYVPLHNDDIQDFFFNYPAFAEYFEELGWYIDHLTIHNNNKDYEVF